MSDDSPIPALDVERVAAAVCELAATLRRTSQPEPLFLLERSGARLAALLLKRTYKLEGGACVLAPDSEQSPFCFLEVPYAKVALPRVAPILADDERYAFKPATDVVVQARAYAYKPGVRRTTASLRFGKVQRELTVSGDRRGEHDRFGRPRFSEPEPFEAVPVRWDHAYGGFDKTAWRRRGMPLLRELKQLRPEWTLRMTPYHYPRNPCGSGYLVDLDEESFEGLVIPNLEHPFAPLSPERLAVGSPTGWMAGPLPAAWDFQSLGWFPRVGYLGFTPRYDPDPARPPAEIERGWAAKDLLDIQPIVHLTSPDQVRLEVGHGAAPGLSVPDVAADERFVLENLHAKRPSLTIQLPGEVPDVRVELASGELTEARAHLSAVVLRVDLDEVELLWSARFPVPASVTEDALDEARRVVRWNRPKARG